MRATLDHVDCDTCAQSHPVPDGDGWFLLTIIELEPYSFIGRRFSPADVAALTGKEALLRVKHDRPIYRLARSSHVLLSYTGGDCVDIWDGHRLAPVLMRDIESVAIYPAHAQKGLPPTPALVRYDFGRRFSATDARAIEGRTVQIAWATRGGWADASGAQLVFDGESHLRLAYDADERIPMRDILYVYVEPIGR